MSTSGLIAILVLSALAVVLLRQSAKGSQKRKPYRGMKVENQGEVYDLARVAPKWHEIQAMLKNGPSGLRSALFEAD